MAMLFDGLKGEFLSISHIDGIPIGSTGPSTGAFTDLDVSGDATFGATTRVTIGGGANADGVVFGSLGTATKAIDFSGSGLSGGSDYWWLAGEHL